LANLGQLKYLAALVFYVSAVALTPIPPVLGLVLIWFILFALLTDFGLVTRSMLLLRDYSRENSMKIKKLVLVLLITGLLAYVFCSIK
jgi:4-hydroxybenzoate polyprenyltransferase